MKDQELVNALREHAEWAQANEWETPITLGDDLTEAADRIEAQAKEIEALRNELCLKCGNYTLAHEGACDGCRWEKRYDMAISALRQQEHFRDLTKNVEPLTLDELRQMDGEPVYCVEITGREEWLFRRDGGFADMYGEFTSDDFMSWDNYGKLWWCYRQKPAEEDDEDDHEF